MLHKTICELDNVLFNKNVISVVFILDTVSRLRKVLLLKAGCVVLSFERLSQK